MTMNIMDTWGLCLFEIVWLTDFFTDHCVCKSHNAQE
jgi:hypothetical protein